VAHLTAPWRFARTCTYHTCGVLPRSDTTNQVHGTYLTHYTTAGLKAKN